MVKRLRQNLSNIATDAGVSLAKLAIQGLISGGLGFIAAHYLALWLP